MSSQPPASAPTSGISKSAAKKRAKKARAAANKQLESAQAGSAAAADTATHPSLERYLYTNPPGSYPADDRFDDSNVYYDDDNDDLPPPASSAQGSRGGRADETFSFASYAFGDRTFEPPTNGSPFGGLSQSINITHEDLLETANELWKRMGETQYGEDDPYWSSLPPHVRQFIREAIPFNAPSNTSNDPQATQKDLYAMAQRIVHAASQGMGLQGVGSNLLSQVNGRAHLQASIAEDLGFHRHPDAGRIDDDLDDDEDFEDEPEPGHVQANGDAPKKKNKKKKKKAASSQSAADPPPAVLPPPAVKQPPRQPVPPQPSAQQPALNPPPPPVAPVPSQPPPSSRAAGKQPMASGPPSNAPARSVRAAGKAPVSASSQHAQHSHPHAAPRASNNKGKAVANPQPAKIWTTASPEEREAITFFWLGLKDSERRELLRIEKDAVLKRMKEQQRHSCGCAVCGRKKINIELELDQLYDQYCEDLDCYTEHARAAAVDHEYPPLPGAGPFPGSVELDSTGQLLKLDHLAPHFAQPPSLDESDDYEDEDEYDDDEELDDDDLASDEDDVDYPPRKSASKALTPKPEGGDDFFGFGSSLATIKGIITVADDMLKNDGAKFLEMMEQLAVKRSVREEQNVNDLHEEETDDEEEDDDDISESHRIADGRRMFAIFAARMFEQRVLQAYREGLAKEREEQLLRELELEEDTKRQKEEKKAKEAQRKKDKKKLQKQRQEEERAAREAAQAEEQRLAKLKAEEEAKERVRKQEEERQRREAVKRAAQEEASRKDAERKKRQEEERAREEEAARKKREREDKVKKEREAREREAKDKERREKEERDRLAKVKAEKDRAAKEAKDKADKERQVKLDEERAERQRRDDAARREREAVEQKKLLAAQQAAREKAAADKAGNVRPPRKGIATAPPPSRNGPTPQSSTPAVISSPPTPGNARSGSSSRAPKTPQQTYGYQQPVPAMAYGARPPQPPGFAPGSYGRPQAGFSHSAQSPVFAPSNGQMQVPGSLGGSLSGSPSASVPRITPDTFDSFESRAPIGVGYPKNTSGPSRVASAEDPFRSSAVPPIGQRVPSQPASVYGDHDDPNMIMGALDPIAPPGPIGSRAPGFDSPVSAPPTSATAASTRQTSPTKPEQVFGSAALGDDDEIVQPAARRAPPPGSWKLPPAPGAGRWSAAPPSIWGMESPWSAPAPAPAPGPRFQSQGPPLAPLELDPRRFNQPYYGNPNPNPNNNFGQH